MDHRTDDGAPPPDSPPAKRARRVGPTSRGSTSYARKRAVSACQVCRSRRTKCDNKKPKCSFCERTGAECVMAPDAMSTFDPASLRILERLDELQTHLQESIRASTQSSPEHSRTPVMTAQPSPNHLFPGNLDALLDWPAVKQYRTSRPGLVDSAHAIWVDGSSSLPTLNIDLDSSTCGELLDNFFHFVHIKNPVLEENQTRRMVRRVFSEGIGWDPESCLALIICANGAIVRSFWESSLSESDICNGYGPVLFRAAQKRLGIVIVNHGLITAQCLFYFGVYRMCMLQPNDAWRMFLQALASCQQFRFLTETTDPLTPTDVAHAEECIYWSCWKSERELRWVLRPPDFGELANDHPKSFPSLPEGLCGEEQLRGWYFYLSEISLWRLSTRARRDTESFEADTGSRYLNSLANLSKRLEQKAIDWSQSLAPAVDLARSSPQEESEVLRFILRGHVTSYYELIWWPFVDAVINQGNASPDVVKCASKGLKTNLDCLTINKPGYHYRHHGTWLLQQSCIRSALVLLAASKSDSAMHLLPAGWDTAVADTIAMLRYWQRNNASTSSSIITLLENMLER